MPLDERKFIPRTFGYHPKVASYADWYNHLLGIAPVKERTAIAIGYGAILLWMFLPMIPVFVAGAIASHYGAQLDEGSPHPCIVFGRDIGGTLYRMEVMGWFGLLTFPSGFLMLIVLTVMVIKGRRN